MGREGRSSNSSGKNGGSGGGKTGASSPSHRLERVEKEIRDVVGTYLLTGFRGGLPGLISLTRVRVSADLKLANFNFTMILTQPEGESAQEFEKRSLLARREAEDTLNESARDVQAEIAHKLKMRFTPKVRFYYDTGLESALKVEKILRDMSVGAGRGDDLPSTKFTDESSSAFEADDES